MCGDDEEEVVVVVGGGVNTPWRGKGGGEV